MVDDPAHYRWSSYRNNALVETDPRLTCHPLYQSLASSDNRALFRTEPDQIAVDDIRLALNQNQPVGNERFLARIERMTGIRREAGRAAGHGWSRALKVPQWRELGL